MDIAVYILYISVMKNLFGDCRILRAHKTFCSPDWRWKNCSGDWKGLNLWFVLDGRGTLRINDREYPLGPGDCFIQDFADDIDGTTDPARPLVVPWVHFTSASVRKDGIIRPTYYRKLDAPAFFETIAQRLIEAFSQDGGKSPVALHWLQTALVELHRQGASETQSLLPKDLADLLEQICLEIRERPQESWDIPKLARRFHYSPDHFARVFRQVKGVSPKKFVLQCRMETARALLRVSDHPVGRVAELLGYNDVYFFSKQFRALVGTTPTAYRKSGRGR
jgi:AraC-like DNA-binding protein